MNTVRNPNSVVVHADRDIRSRRIDFVLAKTSASMGEGPQIMRGEWVADIGESANTFSLTYEEAEELATQLSRAGIRSPDENSTAGHLSALQAHIKALEGHNAVLQRLLHHHLGMST